MFLLDEFWGITFFLRWKQVAECCGIVYFSSLKIKKI